MSSGIGYNGMPIGCSDDKLPWAREAKNVLDTKYPYGQLLFISGQINLCSYIVCVFTEYQLFVYISICFG